ncbi:hypothetical protein [Streptococcus plurextorum]|uniref:hypothetical protein n=1 Tax=Streptococcus plurextorum TaxID=456876 RepID=UPI00041F5BB1|nr:hypothetical protein [Streptococcus plurextorum]
MKTVESLLTRLPIALRLVVWLVLVVGALYLTQPTIGFIFEMLYKGGYELGKFLAQLF